MSDQRLDLLRPSYDGPESWLWFAGFSRIIVLVFAFTAAYFSKSQPQLKYLVGFFGFGLMSSIWYLSCIRIAKYPSSLTTWTQVLIDFGVMIATVNFTGGAGSFFTFLFVLVILEVGLLLGLFQAFVFECVGRIDLIAQIPLHGILQEVSQLVTAQTIPFLGVISIALVGPKNVELLFLI